MIEFTVNGRNYRAAKMDALKQWNVVRRLSPLIGSFGGLAAVAAATKEGESPVAAAGADAAIAVAARALASMSDEDSDFILGACLSLCERQSENGASWARIWNAQANRLQFQDLNMAEMLQISIAVLKDSLSSFFPELRSILSGAQPA